MSESYTNLQSNGEHITDSPVMASASPSQNSPMTSNNNNIGAAVTTGGNSNTTTSNVPSSSTNQNTTNNNTKVTNSDIQPILTKPRLQELVREVDPTEQLDEEVEELLLQIADDFVEDTVKAACLFAKHRKVSKVEIKDVQLHLERKWNMWIPGFGTDELKPYKRATITEAHKQRLALIRKTIKKY